MHVQIYMVQKCFFSSQNQGINLSAYTGDTFFMYGTSCDNSIIVISIVDRWVFIELFPFYITSKVRTLHAYSVCILGTAVCTVYAVCIACILGTAVRTVYAVRIVCILVLPSYQKSVSMYAEQQNYKQAPHAGFKVEILFLNHCPEVPLSSLCQLSSPN